MPLLARPGPMTVEMIEQQVLTLNRNTTVKFLLSGAIEKQTVLTLKLFYLELIVFQRFLQFSRLTGLVIATGLSLTRSELFLR